MRLRIIAGSLRGRQLEYPDDLTLRPMSDRVREALFNILGPIDGLKVLEVYAGTGALSFEALSRGATSAIIVEKNPELISRIKHYVGAFDLSDRCEVIFRATESWLVDAEVDCDLIFSDPPYDQLDPAVQQELVKRLVVGGTLVLSHSARLSPPELKDAELVTTRTYGSRALSFYKRTDST